MSTPLIGPSIAVRPDALAAFAAELAALADELSDDAAICRSAAASLSAALPGDEGWASGGTATAWSRLVGALAERSSALAGTLAAAAAAYGAADALLGDRIGGAPADRSAGGR